MGLHPDEYILYAYIFPFKEQLNAQLKKERNIVTWVNLVLYMYNTKRCIFIYVVYGILMGKIPSVHTDLDKLSTDMLRAILLHEVYNLSI